MSWWIPLLGASAVMGAASTPHCAVMCGPLACAACGDGSAQARTAGVYSLGRALSYTAGGAAMGALGATLLRQLDAARVHQASAALMAVALVLSARRLWSASRASPLVPLRRGRAMAPSTGRALGLGLLTGVLPCGALVSAMMLAASSGVWSVGAAVMLVYALASAPGTLGPALAGALVVKRLGAQRAWVRRGLSMAMMLAAVWVAARPWMVQTGHCHCHEAGARAPAASQGGHA